MATDTGITPDSAFAPRRLLLLIGVAAVVFYSVTLSHWISLLSLPTVARVSGWLWQPELNRPLTLIVLAPFRLLPDAWIPFLLNVFTTLLAAVVLMLLARSVSLLRHDLKSAGALRNQPGADLLTLPSAWMPPVLAVTVCGLQLSFWENATSATGDMIVVTAFAYSFRCILEFRIDQQQKWLSRCAFIYGLGMADSWVLLAYFPVFLGAIIWVKSYGQFLNIRFLLRMVLWGTAGLSLYLLLPLIRSLSSAEDPGFWMALKAHLSAQKQALSVLATVPFRLLLFTAMLPFLALAVRWKSHTIQLADDSRLGLIITRGTGHIVHGLYLIAALWIMLDPPFSPRSLRVGNPMLIYYYTWALVAGYCTGYLLVFTQHTTGRLGRRLPVATAWILLCSWPCLLGWKGLSSIWFTNGPALSVFASELYDGLPDGPSVVLSEDPRRLLLVEGRATMAGHRKTPLLVDTTLLTLPRYHTFLNRRYGDRWPSIGDWNAAGRITPGDLEAMMLRIAEREPIIYLHPSSGHFLEAFLDEPEGSIHPLCNRSTNVFGRVRLSDSLVADNEMLWQERWTGHLRALAGRNAPHSNAREQSLLTWLGVTGEQNATASLLGRAYSKSLNHWGVQMQRQDRWAEAGPWFKRAILLNPDNVAAAINLAYNERYQAGEKSRLDRMWAKDRLGGQLAMFGSWWEVVGDNGPVDEPTYLCLTGRILLSSGNTKQAITAFSRCLELSPDWPTPKLLTAESLNKLGDFQTALRWTDEVEVAGDTLAGPGLARLLHCRVTSLLGLGLTNDAVESLEEFASLHGDRGEVLSAAAALYAGEDHFSEGLKLIDALLEREPENPELLTRKGLAELRLARFEQAVATLSQAISLAPSDPRLLRLRAIACIGCGQLEAAREDYLILLKRPGNQRAALYALGEIEVRRQQTNSAIHYFQQYLIHAKPGSVGYTNANRRLKELSSE